MKINKNLISRNFTKKCNYYYTMRKHKMYLFILYTIDNNSLCTISNFLTLKLNIDIMFYVLINCQFYHYMLDDKLTVLLTKT